MEGREDGDKQKMRIRYGHESLSELAGDHDLDVKLEASRAVRKKCTFFHKGDTLPVRHLQHCPIKLPMIIEMVYI